MARVPFSYNCSGKRNKIGAVQKVSWAALFAKRKICDSIGGMKKKQRKVTFKPYSQEQRMLLPSLEELIPEEHLVRMVNQVVDEMDISG